MVQTLIGAVIALAGSIIVQLLANAGSSKQERRDRDVRFLVECSAAMISAYTVWLADTDDRNQLAALIATIEQARIIASPEEDYILRNLRMSVSAPERDLGCCAKYISEYRALAQERFRNSVGRKDNSK